MGTDIDFAAIGKTVKRALLLQQAKVNAGLARMEAVELAKFGWPTTRSDELEKEIADLEKLVSDQSAAQEQSRVAKENLSIVIDEGHTYVRRLRAALRPILRALPKGDTTAAMFKSGPSLHNSVANLSAYFAKIRPGVEHLAVQLQAALSGTPSLESLDLLRAKLDSTSTAAALARNKIPELTQALNEAQGHLLLNLRDMASIASVAFDAEPKRMGKFYLDLIAGRKAQPATTVTVTTPAEPAAPGSSSVAPAVAPNTPSGSTIVVTPPIAPIAMAGGLGSGS